MSFSHPPWLSMSSLGSRGMGNPGVMGQCKSCALATYRGRLHAVSE